jgi:hypothetical protein
MVVTNHCLIVCGRVRSGEAHANGLSPLVFEHIIVLGRYAFSVPETVPRGELRPLRSPAEATEEVA